MVSLCASCLTVHGLSSKWKQTCFLNDLRSHKIDIVATETKLKKLLAFSNLLKGYEKNRSPNQTEDKGGVVVLIQKKLAMQTCTIFVDLEGDLVNLDLTFSGRTFRLIGIYMPCLLGKQNEFYQHLENFLVRSMTIVMSGNFNAILDSCLYNIGSTGRKCNSHLINLLKWFRLADRFRLENLRVPM